MKHTIWAVALLMTLAACATTKKEPEPAPPEQVEAQPEENLLRDRTVVPGIRVGPVFLDMELRKVIEVMGEPVSGADSRIPGGRPALLYRYPDPDASANGSLLVLVREYNQTVYSIEVNRIDSFKTTEGVQVGSSEALVRATYGKPQSTGETVATGTDSSPGVSRLYCYLNGLAVQLGPSGNVEALTVFPGDDLRKICKAR